MTVYLVSRYGGWITVSARGCPATQRDTVDDEVVVKVAHDAMQMGKAAATAAVLCLCLRPKLPNGVGLDEMRSNDPCFERFPQRKNALELVHVQTTLESGRNRLGSLP